jgi:hypothetical protein
LVTCNDNFFRSLILEQNYLEQTIGRLRETDETAGPARECVSRRAVRNFRDHVLCLNSSALGIVDP